jgi:hypothetical protein
MCFPVTCYSSECLQAVESSLNDLCDLLCCAEEYCNHSCQWSWHACKHKLMNVDYSGDTNRWDSDAIVSASATAWIAVNLQGFLVIIWLSKVTWCVLSYMFDNRSGSQTTASQSRNYEVYVSRSDTNVMWSTTTRLLPEVQRVSNVWMKGQDVIVIPASDAEEGVSYTWARYVLQGFMKLCKELKTVKSECRAKFDCSSANCWA